jgi:hypothetical protein
VRRSTLSAHIPPWLNQQNRSAHGFCRIVRWCDFHDGPRVQSGKDRLVPRRSMREVSRQGRNHGGNQTAEIIPPPGLDREDAS